MRLSPARWMHRFDKSLSSLPGGIFSSAGAGVKTNLVFFRKDPETEKIWYYDLSDVKVGKKKPLTKAAFENFSQLLPTRGDSERSWTIDFAARLQKALDEAKPFRDKAAEFAAHANELEAALREKKKAKTQTREQIEKLDAEWKAVDNQARENQAKVQEIEDSVYDLKAVNPNRVTEQDTRTPAELLDFIAEKGKEADAALERLRQLVANPANVARSSFQAFRRPQDCRNCLTIVSWRRRGTILFWNSCVEFGTSHCNRS